MTAAPPVGMLAAHTAMARRPVAGSNPRRWPAVRPDAAAAAWPPATSARRLVAAPAWLPPWPLFLALLLTLACSAPFVVFALVTLAGYVHGQLLGAVFHADFLNYYSAARMLLEQPRNLYSPGAEAAFQSVLAGGASVYDQFWSPPQVALLYVPFALLPYGVAYLAWLLINLGLLALSAHWLA